MDADSSMHIVIFPWLAFGHLLPCLDLSQRLAARGHRVSFVSTPRNISRLSPVPPALAPLINLVALPLPRVDGLPDGAEATSDVPADKYELHRKAFDGLAVSLSAFLDNACTEDGGCKKPDWVIADSLNHWVAAAAQDHKVPCVVLLIYSAATSVDFGVPSESILGPHEATGQSEVEPCVDGLGLSIAQRFLLTFQRSHLVAQRSCLELEPESIPLLPKIFGKPVVPFGLLPPSLEGGRSVGKDSTAREQEDAILSWLDGQPARSVVYVALGSEVTLSVELVHELALGLELAETRFLWALRKPSGLPANGTIGSVLPEGFEESNRGRGLVTMGLAPQIRILAHGAVGAFLTHCGWSSTIEGLQSGHPLVMLPFFGDQWPNARLMERRKVGVQVARNGTDGSFDRDGVARAVRAVMVEEEGRVFAANAKKLQEIVADRECHERCIDEFIQHLKSHKKH